MNPGGKVAGALQTACQDNPVHNPCEENPNCVAVCIDGGPVSRVESLMMDEIVGSVRIMDREGKRRETYITIERVSFSELFSTVEC